MPLEGGFTVLDVDGRIKVAAVTTVVTTNSNYVTGPASAVDGHLAVFDSTSGKLIKDGGAIGGSGGYVLLEQHTASASASLVFTTGITSTYDSYEFDLINVLPANAAVNLLLKVSTDAGVSYVAGTDYYGAVRIEPNTGATGLTQTGAAAAAIVFPAVDNTALRGGVSGKIQMFNPLSAVISKSFTMQLYAARAGDVTSAVGFMLWFNATAVNAIQFIFSAGNIASGTIRLYGVAKS